LFGTDFTVDRFIGAQTTLGVWVKAMNDQQRIIFDVEGGNSSERGDQSDETQEALACFALAVSDIVILNIKADQLW